MKFKNSYNIQQYKTYRQIRNIHFHNSRDERCTQKVNINTSRSHLNRDLLNGRYGNKPLDQIIKDYVATHHIQVRHSRNATNSHASVLAVNLLFQPSHDYALPNGQISSKNIDAWVDAIMHDALPKILNGQGEIVAANLHMDETSPHLHITVIPVDHQTKRLINKHLFSGRANKIKHHNIIYQATQHLGFKRAAQKDLTATPSNKLEEGYQHFNTALAELPFNMQYPHPGDPPQKPSMYDRVTHKSEYRKQKAEYDQRLLLHYRELTQMIDHAKAVQMENVRLKLDNSKLQQLEEENRRLGKSLRVKAYKKLEAELILEQSRTSALQLQMRDALAESKKQGDAQLRVVQEKLATVTTKLNGIQAASQKQQEDTSNRNAVIEHMVNQYRNSMDGFMSKPLTEREQLIKAQIDDIEAYLAEVNETVNPPIRLGELVVAIITDETRYKGKIGLTLEWTSLIKQHVHDNTLMDTVALRQKLLDCRIPKAFTKKYLTDVLDQSKLGASINDMIDWLYDTSAPSASVQQTTTPLFKI